MPPRSPWRVEHISGSKWVLINDSIDDVATDVYLGDPSEPSTRLTEWKLFEPGRRRVFKAKGGMGQRLDRIAVTWSRSGRTGDDETAFDLVL
jgi:hypothetical protein